LGGRCDRHQRPSGLLLPVLPSRVSYFPAKQTAINPAKPTADLAAVHPAFLPAKQTTDHTTFYPAFQLAQQSTDLAAVRPAVCLAQHPAHYPPNWTTFIPSDRATIDSTVDPPLAETEQSADDATIHAA
jgi:hypothetical protein